jgi:Uncharacterized protein conserved in bacteria
MKMKQGKWLLNQNTSSQMFLKTGEQRFGTKKYGYIDKTGKEIIPIKYDGAKLFSEDLLGVNLKGKWGFIDKTGKEIIPLKYEDVGKFKEGLAAVKLTGKWGFIDKSGAQIIPLQFEEVKYFYNGMSGAKLNNLWGIIDKSGNEIVPFKYVAVSYFDKNEYVQVKINNDTWKFLDMNGKLFDTYSKIVENYTFNNSYSDYKNFKSYSGEMLFRPVYIPLPNGRGKITYIDGSTYEGYISMGNPQGTNGKMIYANGDVYIGGWNEDKYNGFGVLTTKDGSSYEGNWKAGIMEGKGKYTFSDGAVYEGDFENNILNGYGTFTWPNGDKFPGYIMQT